MKLIRLPFPAVAALLAVSLPPIAALAQSAPSDAQIAEVISRVLKKDGTYWKQLCDQGNLVAVTQVKVVKRGTRGVEGSRPYFPYRLSVEAQCVTTREMGPQISKYAARVVQDFKLESNDFGEFSAERLGGWAVATRDSIVDAGGSAQPSTPAATYPPFGKTTKYAQYRKALIAQGWQPDRMADAVKCSADEPGCFPELHLCGSGGSAACRYTWRRGTARIEVIGVGEGDQTVDGILKR